MYEPQELPYPTCLALLASGVVGRVGFCATSGPKIFTVNYAVIDEAVIFRTTPHGALATDTIDAPIAFQVDHVDYEYHRGWSVLATGRAQAVERPEELDHIRAVWEPQPWAGGPRAVYIRLAWNELAGRQLGHGWDPKARLPVRRTVAAAAPRIGELPD